MVLKASLIIKLWKCAFECRTKLALHKTDTSQRPPFRNISSSTPRYSLNTPWRAAPTPLTDTIQNLIQEIFHPSGSTGCLDHIFAVSFSLDTKKRKQKLGFKAASNHTLQRAGWNFLRHTSRAVEHESQIQMHEWFMHNLMVKYLVKAIFLSPKKKMQNVLMGLGEEQPVSKRQCSLLWTASTISQIRTMGAVVNSIWICANS